MTPSTKEDEMERAMQRLFGYDRREMIKASQCVPKPYGCGGPAKWFRDVESVKEFTISGLCQKCQDEVFGASEGVMSEGPGNQDDCVSPSF